MPINHTQIRTSQIRTIQIVRMFQIITLAAVACALTAVAAKADSQSFNVSLNTSVSSLPGTTQVIFFGFTNGDGTPDNSLTLSNFNFGGGSPDGSPTYGGSGVSGDLSSSISMTDADFSESFDEQFTVGSSLSFQLTTTNVFASGAMTPDNFSFLICDPTFSTCYSDDGSGALLSLNLVGGTLSPTTSFSLFGASAQGLPAPVVTVASGTTTAPEPSSLLLLLGGIVALFAGSTLRNRIQSAC